MTRPQHAEQAETDASTDWPQAAILGSMAALFVARPLLPSESAPQGEGLLFVMIWLLLLLTWAGIGWRDRKLLLHFNLVDAGVLALVGWHTVAALWALFQSGPGRPTLNLLWEWIALVVSYFLVRQLLRTRQAMQTLLAAMIGLAFALSCYGIYQYAVELPALQEQFAANPQAVLQASGFADDPAAQHRFKQRINSNEPYATFALANSLAGYLAPWLVLLFGIAGQLGCARPRPWLALAIAVGMTLVLVICLILTKSRTAYLAVGMGMAFVLIQLGKFGWKVWLSAMLTGVLLAAAAWASGAVDREVLTEAGKSFSYRLQYWQGAQEIIQNQPIFGCGPGRFREHYTRYKAETASEEVLDPHNFLFELTATAGVPALLLFLVLVGLLARRLWRCPELPPSSEEVAPPSSLVWGSLLGPLLAAVVGLSVQFPLALQLLPFMIAGIGFSLWGLWPWLRAGKLPLSFCVIALLVLGVNLLAAGGLNIPAVSGSAWLLLAVVVNATELAEPAKESSTRSIPPLPAVVVGLVLLLLGYWTAYQPVSYARLAMNQLRTHPEQRISPEEHKATLLQAAAADSLSAEPARELASFSLSQWIQSTRADDWQEFENWKTEYLRRRGPCDAAWSQVALWYRRAFAAQPSPELAEQEVAALERAVTWYPHNAQRWAELALAQQRANQRAAARTAAQEALRLSEVTPHKDKQLPAELQQRLQRMVESNNE